MDSRSIVRVASLCAGIGTLDLGFRMAVPTARTIFYVERDAYASLILVKRMEEGIMDDAPIWSDLETFNGQLWCGMVRWDVLRNRFGRGVFGSWPRIFIHCFYRSDNDIPHDHPFDFVSVILWGGYWEHTPAGSRRWYGPLSILYRKAEWYHRIELPPGRRCWTLVFASGRRKSWGFLCPHGHVPWKTFLAAQEQRNSGCD